MTVTICLGLPDSLRHDAAELYWQAFGSKLTRVMGPKHKAIAFLQQAFRSDHAILALSEHGKLLGLIGFKTRAGSFAGGTWADMRHIYGPVGALWRVGLLSMLSRDVENERFLLDGICVTARARSQGIGTMLMSAFCDEARARGYPAVRLDVVSNNPRARALYERLGFTVLKTERLGLLRFVFGFEGSTAMVKSLAV